jgi:hypothetical protein
MMEAMVAAHVTVFKMTQSGGANNRDRRGTVFSPVSLRMAVTLRHLEWWSGVLRLLLERGIRLEVALVASWDQVYVKAEPNTAAHTTIAAVISAHCLPLLITSRSGDQDMGLADHSRGGGGGTLS